jgi:hypothetical protein
MNTNKGLNDFGKELQLANFNSKSNNTNSTSKSFNGNFGMESTCAILLQNHITQILPWNIGV